MPLPATTASERHCAHSAPTVLAAAYSYVRRGWRVVPVPHASKGPVFKGWPRARYTEQELPRIFSGGAQNIGVLTGEPSDWLVDVDLDHPRCVELADAFLPHTPAVFGRSGKPRSHRLYRVTAPVQTAGHRYKKDMLVELRSSGIQTVFPPSTHETGELIEWEDPLAEPAEVVPAVLERAVASLASRVREELTQAECRSGPSESSTGDAYEACVSAMLQMYMVDARDGSRRLYAAACRAVEYGLTDADAVAAIREYELVKPFPRSWSDAAIRQRLWDARKVTGPKDGLAATTLDLRPQVLIDTDEYRVIGQSIVALAGDMELFHRGGVLVRVLREEDGVGGDGGDGGGGGGSGGGRGGPSIGVVPLPNLRERLTRHARFVRKARRAGSEIIAPAHPPEWLVTGVASRAEWPDLRRLSGISSAPVLRPDGTLWQSPGYDRGTGVLYEPTSPVPTVPEAPTRDDAAQGARDLLELVGDFPFETEDHRSAWLAALLTLLGRYAFEGPAPLFLIDANVQGAGKTLLAQTIAWIALGREVPVSSYAHDPEEMRKRVTSIALAGTSMVQLDNLNGVFGNDVMDRVLTSTRWQDRLLCRNQEVELPLTAVWFATGNNVSVAADTARRIVHIRLDVLAEHPEQRSGFRHPGLLAHVRQNRGQLLAAALTILLAYCRAGRPDMDLIPFGGFEGWSRFVRRAVVWAGLPDPCNTRRGLSRQSDRTLDELGQLIEAWRAIDPEDGGVVVVELLARLYDEPRPQDSASIDMKAAIENFVGSGAGEVPSARQLGNKLRSARRRVIGGRYLHTCRTENRRSGAVWRLGDASQRCADSQSRTDSQPDSHG